jgi:hypothetical protein
MSSVDDLLANIASTRKGVSEAGRQTLAGAVSIDHDWSLRFSSEDMLIEAVAGLADEDLEGAYLLAHYLLEAIGCVEIRRRIERNAAASGPQAGHVYECCGKVGRISRHERWCPTMKEEQ